MPSRCRGWCRRWCRSTVAETRCAAPSCRTTSAPIRRSGNLAVILAESTWSSITGSALTQQSVAPTVVWLREHEPDRLRQDRASRRLLRLGADARSAPTSMSSGTGLWNPGCSPSTVTSPTPSSPRPDSTCGPPPVRRPGTQVGELGAGRRRDRATTGDRTIVGGADHVLSAYAAGVNRTGRRTRETRWRG